MLTTKRSSTRASQRRYGYRFASHSRAAAREGQTSLRMRTASTARVRGEALSKRTACSISRVIIPGSMSMRDEYGRRSSE